MALGQLLSTHTAHLVVKSEGSLMQEMNVLGHSLREEGRRALQNIQSRRMSGNMSLTFHHGISCLTMALQQTEIMYNIVGGQDDGGNRKDTILVYDIKTGTQCGRKKMNSKRQYCSPAILDNLLFVGGGHDGVHYLNTVECIPLVDDCSHPRVAETPTYDCSLASLCDQLVMSGGFVGESLYSPGSNMVSVLSPSLNTWLPLPPMNRQRFGHGTCTVSDDTLMVVGGWTDEFISLDSVEVLKF